MILVDSNLLIYATTKCVQQPAATRWLDEALGADTRVALPWISLLAFTRVVTNHRIYKKPLRMHEAVEEIERWLARPNVWMPAPGRDHLAYLARALQFISGDAHLVSDAHVAALAFEHGLTVYSADSDFARFSGLKWVNPLSLTPGV